MNLYVTADTIGLPTGGGAVTRHESDALRTLDPCAVLGRNQLNAEGPEPWNWDECVHGILPRFHAGTFGDPIRLAHFYSGTFGKTVAELKRRGCKVTYTIAAHDRAVSRREHELLGIPFNYPHLIEEPLWQRYIEGYRLADVIICPSTVAAETVRGYGPEFRDKRIEVIPHGCEIPDTPIAPLPEQFTVGYLGAIGPDKGLVYLLQAWKKLGYRDGSTLRFAGRESIHPWFKQLAASVFGGENALLEAGVNFCGGFENPSDFYNGISLLVQPSATEGFGIPVLEAMAHGRPVVCSRGAGAADVVPPEWLAPAANPDVLAFKIDTAKSIRALVPDFWLSSWRQRAANYTWECIKERYVQLWKEMLCC